MPTLPKEPSPSTPQVAAGAGDLLSKVGVKPQHKAKQDPVYQVTKQLGKIKIGKKPKQDVTKKGPKPKS